MGQFCHERYLQCNRLLIAVCWPEQVGQVDSPGFTRAFFDLYLGTDPVSQDGKASIAKGLAAVISKAGSEK